MLGQLRCLRGRDQSHKPWLRTSDRIIFRNLSTHC